MPLALLALEGRPRDIFLFRQAARLATFAVLPLIPGGADGVTKLLVVLAEELVLRSTFGGGGAFPGESVHCAIMAALVALKEVWPLALGGRLERREARDARRLAAAQLGQRRRPLGAQQHLHPPLPQVHLGPA